MAALFRLPYLAADIGGGATASGNGLVAVITFRR
jgi:hypothetical protein